MPTASELEKLAKDNIDNEDYGAAAAKLKEAAKQREDAGETDQAMQDFLAASGLYRRIAKDAEAKELKGPQAAYQTSIDYRGRAAELAIKAALLHEAEGARHRKAATDHRKAAEAHEKASETDDKSLAAKEDLASAQEYDAAAEEDWKASDEYSAAARLRYRASDDLTTAAIGVFALGQFQHSPTVIPDTKKEQAKADEQFDLSTKDGERSHEDDKKAQDDQENAAKEKKEAAKETKTATGGKP